MSNYLMSNYTNFSGLSFTSPDVPPSVLSQMTSNTPVKIDLSTLPINWSAFPPMEFPDDKNDWLVKDWLVGQLNQNPDPIIARTAAQTNNVTLSTITNQNSGGAQQRKSARLASNAKSNKF